MAGLHFIMHDPNYFKDPEDFKPERFLNPTTGEFTPDERVIPFSIGKRACLGQAMGDKQFFLFFTGLMSQFQFIPSKKEELPSYFTKDSYPTSMVRGSPKYSLILRNRKP